MLKELALKWFEKNQYNTKLLRKIAKIINPLLYLSIGFIAWKRILFDKKHKPFKIDPLLFDIDRIIKKSVLYHSLVSKTQDGYGFIETSHCDALLFSGLLSATNPFRPVSIHSAQNSEGAWFRRPLGYPPCYVYGKSGSTISRDMLMGVLWHSWVHKDRTTARQLQDYGRKHDWVMGEGDISRLYFGPGLRATLAEMCEPSLDLLLPQSWPKGLKDYEAHLALLHIELLGQIWGHINTSMKECLSDIAKTHQKNALAQLLYAKWVTGEYVKPLLLLDDENIWPLTQLPTSKNRREGWITQRADDSDGWLPAEDDDVVTHSGGDYLFCMMILFGANR